MSRTTLVPVLFAVSFISCGVALGVDHPPAWIDSSTLRYDLPGEGTSDYVGEFDPGSYGMCRYGNWLASGNPSIQFNDLTSPPFTTVGMDAPHPGGLFVWGQHRVAGNRRLPFSELLATWQNCPPTPSTLGLVNITIDDTSPRDLYRYLSFTDGQLVGISPTTTNYIILIHGWNPDSLTNSYVEEFASLRSNIETWLNTRGMSHWKVLLYHMERDTDTGENDWDPIPHDAAINGTEAAEISRLHGYHMAELILEKCPNVKKLHFIAHSAGSWAARSCLKYLLASNSTVQCQMTLLDAFIPNSGILQPFIDSNLGVPEMNAVPSFSGASHARIFNLDNYYSGGDLVLGTQNEFDWGDYERQPDVCTGILEIGDWAGHSGPINYYKDSVPLDELWPFAGGWRCSLAYCDYTNQPGYVPPPPQPSLDTPSVSPAFATTSDTCTYSVHYKDSSGQPPQSAYRRLYIDGNTSFQTMSRTSGTDSDGTYTCPVSGLTTGPHNYYFLFRTAAGADIRYPSGSQTFSGPTVGAGGGSGNTRVYVEWYGAPNRFDPSTKGKRGTVAPAYNGRMFAVGDEMWFTATPDFGWRVSGWDVFRNSWQTGQSSGDPVDAIVGNSAKVIVGSSDRNENDVLCYFTRVNPGNRILTTSVVGPGQISPAPSQTEYALNATVPVTATSVGDSKFVGWRLDGAGQGSNATCTVTMDDDHALAAVFAYNQTAIYTNDLPCIEDSTIFPKRAAYNPTATYLRVSYDQTSPNYTEDSLLKFDISSVPTDATVNSMELHVYCMGRPDSLQRYEIQKNTSAWSESDIVGANPTCDNYDWGYGIANGVYDWHVVDLPSWIPSSVNWITDWRAGNYGLRLRWVRWYYDRGTGDPNCYEFASRHGANAPYLRVVYQGRRLVPGIGVTVSPTNATAEIIKGTSGTNIVLGIRNFGEGTLSYTATSATNWLTLTGASTGTSTGETKQVTLNFNVSGLPYGGYPSAVMIADANASNSPVTVPVTLIVSGPSIGVSPTNLTAECVQGQNPAAATFTIRNSGKGTLTYTLSEATSWFSLSQTSGSSTGDIQSVQVNFDASGLPTGIYAGTITVTEANGWTSPVDIPVRLTVCTDQVAMPYTWPTASATWLTDVGVSLFCATEGATVHYTLDGTFPTESSPTFTNTITLINSKVLIAKAWKPGWLSSATRVDSYSIFPTTVTASDGSLADKVRVTWAAVPGASGYQVWRNTVDREDDSSFIGTSATTNFDDTTVAAGTTNWYWIKGTNAGGTFTTFSYGDSGWRRDEVNLALASRGSTITGTNGKNWGQLIDGVTNGYTGSVGFGYTSWTGVSGAPGKMTLDLKGLCTISSMKMLLWNLDSRYYRYKIEASVNGSAWTLVVNRTAGTWKGWQNLSFGTPIQARYLSTPFHKSANVFYAATSAS